jgi:hypothetical protein
VRKTLAVAILLISACSKPAQNTEAVRQGVIDYLTARKDQTGLDMNLMQVDVTSVAFQKDEARATVYIRPKSGAEGGMQFNYTLERKGSKWAVKGRTENGVNPHGGGTQMGTPAPGTTPGSAPALPPGHPPVGSKQ